MGTMLSLMNSRIFYDEWGYDFFEMHLSVYFYIGFTLQIIMLAFFLYFIKDTESHTASVIRKIPSELIVIVFVLSTVGIYLYSFHDQQSSIRQEEEFYDDIYLFGSIYGEAIRKSILAFIKNGLIGMGYLWILTAATVKIKGRYWREDSLLLKLFRHYNKNRVSPLRRMYVNDILFIFFQLALFLYEVMISNKMAAREFNSIQFYSYLVALPLLCESILIGWKCKVEIKEKDIRSLVNEIHKIKLGQEQIENKIPANSFLYETGEELKNISFNLYNSMQQQMKNEKLKVDLITNISHDLKTPLTSIIGYIDLLAAKDYLNREDKHYITELKKKAENLHNMIKVVFELSKASSGNIKIEKSKLNLNKLIMQTIADMEDTIINSGFIIKTRYAEESLVFWGDGEKLYLVCQNLISNAVKYSLSGSRIYIKTYSEPGNVVFSIQNTSAYEMDFTPDEISARFVRGDESRSDGGNGLGLAIARTYSEVCGGEFNISIEGDMFKVTIKFPIAECSRTMNEKKYED